MIPDGVCFHPRNRERDPLSLRQGDGEWDVPLLQPEKHGPRSGKKLRRRAHDPSHEVAPQYWEQNQSMQNVAVSREAPS